MPPANLDGTRARKRERDKENQRLKRKREKDAYHELEQRNASLEQQVAALSSTGDGNDKQLSEALWGLQERNKALEERLHFVDDFVKGWHSKTRESSFLHEIGNGNPELSTQETENNPVEVSEETSPAVPPQPGIINHPSSTQHTQDLQSILRLPVWKRIPVQISTKKIFDPFGEVIARLKTSPTLFEQSPADPNPIHLFQSYTSNDLANATFRSTSQYPIQIREKFALNLFSYSISRWLIDTTEDNFNKIPVSFRPTTIQLIIPHAPIFDYVIWPQMRDNMIKHGTKYCQSEVFDLLFRSCRIRSHIAADWLDASPGNNLDRVEKLIESSSMIDSWILVDEFWMNYPGLTEGLDPRTVMCSDLPSA